MVRYRSPNDRSPRIKKRHALWLIPLVLFLFFGGFALQAYLVIKQEKLPPAYHNALKHALAAKAVYKTLSLLQVPDPEEKVLKLGLLNEKLEQYVKFNGPDSTLEMIKDMSNNYVGIVVAQQHVETECTKPLVHLIKNGTLVALSYDMRIPRSEKEILSGTRELETAEKWLDDNRNTLRARTMRQLGKCKN